ncbi:MAG: hypothetical protein J1G01_00700 [Clostridiales bacterium]|nr:hypothetical protein [Clostridiales bacterium]
MAEKKKTTGNKGKTSTASDIVEELNKADGTREEIAEALRRAAELIASLKDDDEKPAEKKPAAKKPAAKKPAAKKPAAKKPAAKKAEEQEKPAAKKPAAKKPAAKKAPAKKQPVQQEEQEPVEEVAAADAQAADSVASVTEQPEQVVVEEKPEEAAKVEEPVQPVVAPEEKHEEVAAQPVKEEQAAQPAKEEPVVQPAKAEDKKSLKQKAGKFVEGKGVLPIFIVANVLLGLSALFLLIFTFDISFNTVSGKDSEWYTLFGYYGNGDVIKAMLAGTAFGWADGGYTLIGILATLAVLIPIALIAKNLVLFFVKKDKNIHTFDAIVSIAFLVAFLGIVNLYGVNMTAGHVLALVFSLILLAATIIVPLLLGSSDRLSLYTLIQIVLVLVCMFLITSTTVYNVKGSYAAAATRVVDAGYAFVFLTFTVLLLAALIAIRVRKLPMLVELIISAATIALALISLIAIASAKPEGVGMGGGFVFGIVLTIIVSAASIAFALVPQLRKFTVVRTVNAAAAEQPAEAEQPVEEKTEQEKPVNSGEKIYCMACGTPNDSDASYCCKCGMRLKQ